jgi:beta-galactosidase GanA
VGAVFDLALHYAGIPSLADAAELVEVTRRVKGGGGARPGRGEGGTRPNSGLVPAYTFVLNHYATQQEVRNLPEGADLLSGARCDGKLELEPYGVAIVEEG